MDIVFSSLPIYSHLVPVLAPMAAAAAAAGHRVTVATARSMGEELQRCQLDHLSLPNVVPLEKLRGDRELARRYGLPAELTEPDRHTPAQATFDAITRAFAGPLARVFAQDLIDALDGRRPDLIVRECEEFGGALAAEALGVPLATLDTAPFAARQLPVALPALREARSALGLAPTDDPWWTFGRLRIGVVPDRWYPDELRGPRSRSYRLPLGRSTTPLDTELAALPADRPLVVASLGSLAPTLPGVDQLLTAIVTALADLPVHAVVALGREPRDWSGPRPDTVRLRAVVPQADLLTAADLFVSHCGFGAVREAVGAGTPMVALPLFSDQFGNAERVAELGLGVRLDVERLGPGELAAACRRVLAEPGFRWRATALRRDALADPDATELWTDLAALTDRANR